jgi:hypothetical protein
MFLNLTQHLVEKVMLQKKIINNNNNNNGDNCLRPTRTTLLRNSKTYTKKSSMYGALHCKFGCGSRRMRNIR